MVARAVIAAALLCSIGIATAVAIPYAIDWAETFRPAVLSALDGQSPYTVQGFVSPPWVLPILLPFALVPESLGRAALFVASIAATAYALRRLGASPVHTALFMLSPMWFHMALNGNIDWIPLIGFTLPAAWGIPIVLIKPQMGAFMVVFWAIEAWRRAGWREVVRVFAPLVALVALSFAVFGPWPEKVIEFGGASRSFNASLWPMSLPVACVALVYILSRGARARDVAMSSSTLLSPHVMFHSWQVALLLLIREPRRYMVAAVVGAWALVVIRALAS